MTTENQEVDIPITPTKDHVTYGSYLKIPELLSLQQPLSSPAEHDEMLFIIIHQVYELWFKQILHELDLAEKAIDKDELIPLLRTAKRITTIQRVLTSQVEILETMTPNDFNTFRERLNPASGFQSYQFRLFEFRLGNRDRMYLKFYKNNPGATEMLEAALLKPSFYDKFLHLLSRRGFKIPSEVLNRDVSIQYEQNDKVGDSILEIYRNSANHHDIYLALETLMDIDENILLWRYRHVAMVQRLIGFRRGTGGSSGAKYLTGTLTKRFFPEIWDVRNYLGDQPYGGGDTH